MDDTHYTRHLSEVNESHQVIASEDICNEQGQLVTAKGQSIDAATTERLLKFKLLKPLEESVKIESQLEPDSLYSSIESFLMNDESTSKIWQAYNDEALLKSCCTFLCEKVILQQKLTVLSLQFPELFKKGLFCAWFGAIVIKTSSGSDEKAINAFVAGAMHDIGMLHLNPDFIESTRKLTSEEWRQLRAHPLVSEQILKNTRGVDESVCEAVADHHESLDATGYPAGKISNQIGELAQLLNLLDTCYATFDKHFKGKGRSLADIEPIVQVNQNYRNNINAEKLLLIFRSAGKTNHCFTPREHVDALFDLVWQKHEYVNQFIEKAWKLSEKIGYRHKEKKILGLQNILIHVQITILRSGVSDERYSNWLKKARKEKDESSYREMEDVVLMLTEIMHHFKRFKVALQLFVDENQKHQYCELLQGILQTLNELPMIKVNEQIAEHFSIAV